MADSVKGLQEERPQAIVQAADLLPEWLTVTERRERGGRGEEWKGVRYSTTNQQLLEEEPFTMATYTPPSLSLSLCTPLLLNPLRKKKKNL